MPPGMNIKRLGSASSRPDRPNEAREAREAMTAKRTLRAVLIAPAASVYLALFVLPLGYFALVSFWTFRLYRIEPVFTLANYSKAYSSYLGPALQTVIIALFIAVLTTLLAYAYAFLIRFKAGRFGDALLFVALITLFGGYLVKIYAWKTMLGESGVVNQLLMSTGVVDKPLSWLLYNPFSVVITLTHYLLPFAVLPIYGALRGIADIDIEAARDLGAGPFRRLVDIILPRTATGLFAGFATAFLISIGDYVTPSLVGGPHTSMIGTFVASQFINRLNAPAGSALTFLTLFLCFVVLALIAAGGRRILATR
ncbi:ABC transporter permease [Mesorhizobium sp. B2-4-2]|nr:ABC transporter permease [Mesorhizobium sp. B2-4-2]